VAMPVADNPYCSNARDDTMNMLSTPHFVHCSTRSGISGTPSPSTWDPYVH
jgi:hypothetical protein